MPAVDFGEHRLAVRLAVFIGGIVPGQIQQRPVPVIGRIRQFGPDAFAQLVEELKFALAVARRPDGLVPVTINGMPATVRSSAPYFPTLQVSLTIPGERYTAEEKAELNADLERKTDILAQA